MWLRITKNYFMADKKPVKQQDMNTKSNVNRNREEKPERTSNQGRKEASGGSPNTNNKGNEKGRGF